MLHWIIGVSDQTIIIMICAPEPYVIDNCVASVNLNELSRAYVGLRSCVESASSGKDIRKQPWVLGVACVARFSEFQERG